MKERKERKRFGRPVEYFKKPREKGPQQMPI